MKPHAPAKEPVDTRILEQITVADPATSSLAAVQSSPYAATSLFATAQTNRFAATSLFAAPQTSRYAVSPYATNRYAAPQSSRFAIGPYAAAPTPNRYATGAARPNRYGRSQPAGGHRVVRRIVVILPPPRTEGHLLWVPAAEFEQSFEGWDEDSVWPLGAVIEFDAAAESRSWQTDDDEDPRIHAYTIDNESCTFGGDDWTGCEAEGWPEAMANALRLRAELSRAPERVAASLDRADLSALTTMLGMTTLPTRAQVTNAITADHTTGLGAAALDHAVWIIPSLFGPLGVQLAKQLKVIADDEYVRLTPQENFLLHSGSLHPGTVGQQGCQPPGHLSYPMHGDYVVARIGYRSDLDGTVVGAWRSVYLEPFGQPQYPAKQPEIK
jgi:hypothetical protein